MSAPMSAQGSATTPAQFINCCTNYEFTKCAVQFINCANSQIAPNISALLYRYSMKGNVFVLVAARTGISSVVTIAYNAL